MSEQEIDTVIRGSLRAHAVAGVTLDSHTGEPLR
jgi:hypothetical protein